MNPAPARSRALLGVTLISLMAACFATMDTSVRYLGAMLPVLLLFWARYAIQASAMFAWLLWRNAKGSFRSAHPRFQLARGALLAITSAMSFYGVQAMPVPEFTAINMLTPLLVILLAAWVLKEPVSPLRWVLVAGGFAGALIVIRPGSGVFGWAVLFPLGGAFTYASFQVLTRKLSGSESPYTTHFYTGLVGTLLVSPVLLASDIDVMATLRATPGWQLGLILVIGALGTIGHLLLILALGMAPTATLMPFVYLQIGVATVLGWLIFHQVPDFWAAVGMGVIALCGAAGAWLNVRSKQTSPDPVAQDTIAD
ncbi:MAG TPA: DMT family transporter [Ideonella sp.]|nr:DMT family transporter [Ideonella sp.]